MEKRTIISCAILLALICLLVGLSLLIPDLWTKYLSPWIIIPTIALTITLLIGLVLMDDIFELDEALIITPRKLRLKIEIRNYLVWALLLVCSSAIIVEVVQFFLFRSRASYLDPLLAIAGAVTGIILHIIGSKWLMKRVEFELERWEDNVL
jgi:hypothetical protein